MVLITTLGNFFYCESGNIGRIVGFHSRSIVYADSDRTHLRELIVDVYNY